MSFDSPKDNAEFAAENDFPFQLLSDTDRSLAMALGLVDSVDTWWAPRVTFIISADGKIEEVIETANVRTQAYDILNR